MKVRSVTYRAKTHRFGSTWYARRPPEMAVRSRAFSAPARVALALALAATLCVSADARRLDARRLDARHARGAARDFRASGVFFEGPAYDGCCDGTDGVVLDCCRDGGCCPGGEGAFLDCCIAAEGDNDGNVRSSKVFFEGPGYDGCCDVAEGEPLMDCCTHGGCCPDGEGVSLSCCASGTDRRASVARLGQAFFSDVGAGDATSALGKRRDASGAKTSDATKRPIKSREDAPRSEDVADGQTVEHEVSPEVAFAPAEEADVNDPTYGAFARLDPGGESYYEKADETKRTAEAAAAAGRSPPPSPTRRTTIPSTRARRRSPSRSRRGTRRARHLRDARSGTRGVGGSGTRRGAAGKRRKRRGASSRCGRGERVRGGVAHRARGERGAEARRRTRRGRAQEPLVTTRTERYTKRVTDATVSYFVP